MLREVKCRRRAQFAHVSSRYITLQEFTSSVEPAYGDTALNTGTRRVVASAHAHPRSALYDVAIHACVSFVAAGIRHMRQRYDEMYAHGHGRLCQKSRMVTSPRVIAICLRRSRKARAESHTTRLDMIARCGR